MARRSLNELLEVASATLPDNTQGLITPADVRIMFSDFLDTMSPSYGVLSIQNRLQQLTQTPQAVIFTATQVSFPPEWDCFPDVGQMRRQLAGVAKLNSRFTINGDILAATGQNITLTLYANGQATPWQQTIGGEGTTNYATFAFVALDRIEVDTTYELRARTSLATPVNVSWQNFTFLGENIPIRDFQIQSEAQLRGVEPFPDTSKRKS